MFSKKKLILNVLLTPKSKNNFEIGSGYASDIGPRSKIIWKKPWINSIGHSLESNISISALEQRIDINYKIPIFRDPINQYYLLQSGYIHEDRYDCKFKIVTFNIARYWNCSDDWQRVINLYGHINYNMNSNNWLKTAMLICPGISMNRIQQRGEIIPYWGHSQRYSINISTNYWKPEINSIILQTQNTWIRTFSNKHRVLICNNLSWMETNHLSCTMSIFRLFFAKERGIRGYKNKALPFQNYFQYIDGTVSTKLITNIIEYQYKIFNKWWGAIFFDFGEITNDISWKDFKSGAGVGIRWRLPVGPVKLDIAIPLIHKVKINHKFLHFYVNLGPEL